MCHFKIEKRVNSNISRLFQLPVVLYQLNANTITKNKKKKNGGGEKRPILFIKKKIIKIKSKTKTYCLKMTNQKSLATGANEMHNQRLSYFIPSRSIVLDKQMQTEILHSVFICTTSNGRIRLEKKDGKQHNSNGTSPSFRLSICRPITLTLKKKKKKSLC